MATRFGMSQWMVAGLVGSVALAAGTVRGAILWSGDVVPADPSTWTSNTFPIVGNTASGEVTINGGSIIGSNLGFIGYLNGSSGSVTITGSGSAWYSTFGLVVGANGSGTLNINDGGLVAVYVTTKIGPVTGAINFGGTGGTLATQALYVNPAQISGNGTINIHGIVSDIDLLFDATHGLNQTFVWNDAVKNVTVNLNLAGGAGGGVAAGGGDLGAGYQGTGSLAIKDGVTVSSPSGYSGYGPGSSGTVTVSGSGSTWNVSNLYVGSEGNGTLDITAGGHVKSNGTIYIGQGSTGETTVDGAGSSMTFITKFCVGLSGSGKLNITNGGTVTGNSDCEIGNNSGSSGAVLVDGIGSNWTTLSFLQVGSSGSGVLRISNGGTVTASSASINSQSTVAMTVGDGSKLDCGTGNMANSGVIRLAAVPGLAADTYMPIVAGSWSGNGTVQALGGRWDDGVHAFIASAAASGVAGSDVQIDRSLTQRVLVTDGVSGHKVDAGFLATPASSMLTLNAVELSGGQMAGLLGNLPAGDPVLAGWTFTAGGYTAGEPVFLSMSVGSGLSREQLEVWHYDGAVWTPVAAGDLSYDGMFANFTVMGFSGYAVVEAVPEPGMLLMLGLGGIGLVMRRQRVRGK